MKKYELPEELGNAVLQYLASKPYEEVFTLITALQQLKPIEDEAKAAKAVAVIRGGE